VRIPEYVALIGLALCLAVPAAGRADDPPDVQSSKLEPASHEKPAEPSDKAEFESKLGERTTARPSDKAEVNECHGPRYYNKYASRKRTALELVERQKARLEVERFSVQVGARLHEAMEKERERTYARLLEEYGSCLKEKLRPSLLCTALVSGREEICREFSGPEEQEPCLQLVNVVSAIRTSDTARCARLESADVKQVCEFAVNRSFSCGEISEGPIRSVCGALAGALEGKEVPPGLDDGARAPLHWLLALLKSDPSLCGEVASVGEAAACRAAVTGLLSDCPPVRHTIEHIDNDYSCRNVIAYEKLHETEFGTELVLAVASPYVGTGRCAIKVQRQVGEGVVVQTLETAAVGGKAGWREVRRFPGRGRVVKVEAACTWDPETSRFVLDDQKARVW